MHEHNGERKYDRLITNPGTTQKLCFRLLHSASALALYISRALVNASLAFSPEKKNKGSPYSPEIGITVKNRFRATIFAKIVETI